LPDIEFDDDGRVRLLTKHHGEVTLSKANWENHICGKPERYHYRLNGEKVATTLIAPDHVRRHASRSKQFVYYKSFPKWQIVPGVQGPSLMMAVVIDEETQRVATVFPVQKPKTGMEFKP
jgi:hypothetical protein